MPQNSPTKVRPTEQAAETETLAAENASLRDRMLRALAEAENTRRRSDRAVLDASRYAITEFAREILGVADNLQRTLTAAELATRNNADEQALLEGVRATLRLLMQILERFGVHKIEALGKPFDPSVHEAVLEVDEASHAPGTVVRIVEEGYMIDDRLLRPARVVVSKRSAQPSQTAADADLQPPRSDHSD
jgi:molecular chaperone GrpE